MAGVDGPQEAGRFRTAQFAQEMRSGRMRSEAWTRSSVVTCASPRLPRTAKSPGHWDGPAGFRACPRSTPVFLVGISFSRALRKVVLPVEVPRESRYFSGSGPPVAGIPPCVPLRAGGKPGIQSFGIGGAIQSQVGEGPGLFIIRQPKIGHDLFAHRHGQGPARGGRRDDLHAFAARQRRRQQGMFAADALIGDAGDLAGQPPQVVSSSSVLDAFQARP